MSIFALLDFEKEVQLEDKTRLDASKSFASKAASELTTSILEINPSNNSTTTFGSLSGTLKWNGGVLAPNGKIYGIPRNSTTVLEILSTKLTDIDITLSRHLNHY